MNSGDSNQNNFMADKSKVKQLEKLASKYKAIRSLEHQNGLSSFNFAERKLKAREVTKKELLIIVCVLGMAALSSQLLVILLVVFGIAFHLFGIYKANGEVSQKLSTSADFNLQKSMIFEEMRLLYEEIPELPYGSFQYHRDEVKELIKKNIEEIKKGGLFQILGTILKPDLRFFLLKESDIIDPKEPYYCFNYSLINSDETTEVIIKALLFVGFNQDKSKNLVKDYVQIDEFQMNLDDDEYSDIVSIIYPRAS